LALCGPDKGVDSALLSESTTKRTSALLFAEGCAGPAATAGGLDTGAVAAGGGATAAAATGGGTAGVNSFGT